MELRRQKRYRQLVESHLNVVQAVAAGVKAIPGVGKAFAATQAAWRFFRNPNVTLPELVQPLRDVGQQRTARPAVFPVHRCQYVW